MRIQRCLLFLFMYVIYHLWYARDVVIGRAYKRNEIFPWILPQHTYACKVNCFRLKVCIQVAPSFVTRLQWNPIQLKVITQQCIQLLHLMLLILGLDTIKHCGICICIHWYQNDDFMMYSHNCLPVCRNTQSFPCNTQVLPDDHDLANWARSQKKKDNVPEILGLPPTKALTTL